MPKNTSNIKAEVYCMCYIVVYNLKTDNAEERLRIAGTKSNLVSYIDSVAKKYKISQRCSDTAIAEDCLIHGGFFSLYDYDKKLKEKSTYRVSVDSDVVEFVG